MIILCGVLSSGVYLLYSSVFPPKTISPQPSATTLPTPTATAILPVWKDQPLIDSPYRVAFSNNSTANMKRNIYNSGVVLDADTRWVFDIQVDKLAQNIGDVSTGISLLGYNKDGNIQNLQLVYRSGAWAVGYSANNTSGQVSHWEVFHSLTSPTQRFELLLTGDGKTMLLKNDNGFQINRTLDGVFFDGAQAIVAEAQIGAQTKISLTRFIIQQLEDASPNALSALPTASPSPTTEASAAEETARIFHVAVDGDDINPGTEEKPFGSIEHARDVIRMISPSMKSPIVVEIHGGMYAVRETIRFGVMDSGQNGFGITYRAAKGETPILSGGIPVTSWRQVTDSQLWKTTLSDVKTFRQLYVNGIRAQRAVSQEPVKGTGWVAGNFSERDGIALPSSSLPIFSRPQDLELHWIYDWRDIRLLAENSEINPEDESTTIFMKQPYLSHVLLNKAGNTGALLYDIPFYLENAFELLDEPGEWYYNPDTQELFYYPREGEDMNIAEVIIPQTEKLLEITGEAVGREAHDIAFEGLTFAYAGWTRTSETGTIGRYAQNLITNSSRDGYYQTMTPAHVQIDSAHDIRFEGCRFEHLGAVALDINNNVFQSAVQGNLFHDISDAAIVVGHWEHAYITAPLIQAAPSDNLVTNNLIHNVGVEYWGAPAITAYYTNNLRILHNEISSVPYTGISLGWGWSGTTDSTTAHHNHVANNLITDVLQRARDGAGIYTLGQQPGSIIEGNVIRRAERDHGCLYPDQGSAFIIFDRNVCDSALNWLFIWIDSIHDIQVLNSFTNVEKMRNDGVNIHIESVVIIDGQNWTTEAQSIIDNAGLEQEYKYLHDWLPSGDLE